MRSHGIPPHAASLRQLGRGPQRRLARQPSTLLRTAHPGLVPARRAGRTAPTTSRSLPDEADLPDRPVDRRPERVRREPTRSAGRLHGRPRRVRHVGNVVAHAPDRRRVGGGRRPVRARVPDGPASAGPRHHPDLAVLHDRESPAARRLGAVAPRDDLRLDPRPRPQEDVEVEGQRRHATGPLRDLRNRCRALLGGARPDLASTPRSAKTR